MQTDKNSCTNCRYFSQHYSKQGTQYIKVFCGHCLHNDKKIKMRKFPFDACGLWDIARQKRRAKTLKRRNDSIYCRVHK